MPNGHSFIDERTLRFAVPDEVSQKLVGDDGDWPKEALDECEDIVDRIQDFADQCLRGANCEILKSAKIWIGHA